MTHHRNFYFEKVTTRATVGETNRAGLTYAHDVQRDLNPLDALELASKCLFFGVLTLVGLIFFGAWFVYSNLIA